MTILVWSARLFGDHLGKTRGGNSLHFRRSCLYALVSWWVSCSSG